MSTPVQPTTTPADALKAATETAQAAVKVANELKSRLDKAPKAASPEALKAAAVRLVDFRWVKMTDPEKVAAALADPDVALNTLAQVAQLAAEKVAALDGTGRLAAGAPIGETKQASATTEPESDADRIWTEKMAARRQQLR